MNNMWTRKHLLKSLLALGLLPLSSFAQSKDEAQKEEVLPKKVDVIVIGSGAAGMSAAIAARDKGARTVVLEKMPIIGGNTLISSGVVNAPDEKNQKLQGIEDSNEWFYKQTLAAGHDKADPVLVKVLTDRSYQTIQWLESIGVKFKKGVFQVYGGLWPRGHYPSVSHGRGYVAALSEQCRAKDIPILTNVQVVGLIKEGSRVIGVEARFKNQLKKFYADKAVIIASGGFSANKALYTKLDPRLEGMTFTGASSATGEMIGIAEKAGAAVSDMEYIQCNLGPDVGYSHRSGYHLDVTRHVLVNIHGKRFVAEDGARDYLRDAVLQQPNKIVYSIVDKNGIQNLSSLFQQAGILGEIEGEHFENNDLAELAKKMKVPPENLVNTIKEYNQAVETKKDPYGREVWMLTQKIETPPFYAARVRMAVHYTMGGIVINENAQVLTKEREPKKVFTRQERLRPASMVLTESGATVSWMHLCSGGSPEKMQRSAFDTLRIRSSSDMRKSRFPLGW